MSSGSSCCDFQEGSFVPFSYSLDARSAFPLRPRSGLRALPLGATIVGPRVRPVAPVCAFKLHSDVMYRSLLGCPARPRRALQRIIVV